MINSYEGVVKSAVYSPELTEKWGATHGGLGYTLHIFIDKINGESVESVLNIPHAVIEMNVYSEPISKRYHYKDIKTGYTKSSYLKIVSPLIYTSKTNKVINQNLEISDEVTQRISLSSKSTLELKKHRRLEGEFYTMSDKETYFYRIRKAHIKDLWIAEDYIKSSSSYSSGLKLAEVA